MTPRPVSFSIILPGWVDSDGAAKDVAIPALHQPLTDTFGNGGFIYCENPPERTTKFK